MDSETSAGGRRITQAVFMTAVLLAVAYNLFGILANLYLRPVVVSWLSGLMPTSGQQAFLGNIDAESFYGNVIQNLINFAISPVIFLYVFYRLGSRLKANPSSSYFQLLEYSFLGGIAGYVLGYILTVGVIWATQGGYSFGDSWFAFVIAISVVREAVFMALFAFTGVYVGYLRSNSNHESLSEANGVVSQSPGMS